MSTLGGPCKGQGVGRYQDSWAMQQWTGTPGHSPPNTHPCPFLLRRGSRGVCCAGEHAGVCACLSTHTTHMHSAWGWSSFLPFPLKVQPRGLVGIDFPWALSTSLPWYSSSRASLGGVSTSSNLSGSCRSTSLQESSPPGQDLPSLSADAPAESPGAG